MKTGGSRAKSNRISGFWKNLPRFFLFFALLIMCMVFVVLQPKFLSFRNAMDIMRTASIYSLLGMGGMLVMTTGDFNYALGAEAMIAAIVTGLMYPAVPYPLACVCGILAAILVGLVASFVVIRLKVASFVATLALHTLVNGVTRLLTGGSTLFDKAWGETFAAIGRTNFLGAVPLCLILMLAIALVMYIFLEHRQMGRFIYASGANATAARQVGIPVDRIRLIAHVLCAVCCGAGGILYASIANSVPVTTANEPFTPALACVILGATFLTPGKYNVPGTILASIMIVITQNGVVSVGAPYYLKDIVLGVMLGSAVGIIALSRKAGLPKVSFSD